MQQSREYPRMNWHIPSGEANCRFFRVTVEYYGTPTPMSQVARYLCTGVGP